MALFYLGKVRIAIPISGGVRDFSHNCPSFHEEFRTDASAVLLLDWSAVWPCDFQSVRFEPYQPFYGRQ